MKKFLKKIGEFFNDDSRKMKKNDFIIIGCLLLIYSIISFTNLGSTKNPQTFVKLGPSKSVTYQVKKDTNIKKIRFFSGDEAGNFIFAVSEDGHIYNDLTEFKSEYCFSWYDVELNSKFKYFRISTEKNADIGEIQLYDDNLNKIALRAGSDDARMLIDEEDVVPEEISYMNSVIFDEVYFARSAYQYVHGIDAMEWVHPPLGKLIQSIPIHFMGMSPFAYRLMGNIAGILIILVMYIFGKTIFKSRKCALLAAFLMAFDTFHFAQTRLGTVDSHLILFMLLSSLFMYKYLILGKDESLKKRIINLFFCGLFFGLSCCVKWTGLYLGMGLAIVFFSKIIYDIAITRKKDKNNVTIRIDKQLLVILGSCIIFFIAIPATLYVLCYFLFPNVVNYSENSLSGILKQIQDMYTYHSTLTETHPFSSPWYTWPLMGMPVWFYVKYLEDGLKMTITNIGNPAIWWLGILAVNTLIGSIRYEKDKKSFFIVIMFLACWLPYLFIGRVMFMYHFFPSLPFLMLAIVGLINNLTKKHNRNWIWFFYMLIVLILFIIFYPVVSGMVMPNSYIDSLKWFKTWIF